MKPLPLTGYAKHKADWLGCTRCQLADRRTKVVLVRGKLPCDILFVGEAPGESEDVLGSPFVGPAGQLLDQIVGGVMDNWLSGTDGGHSLRWAFTNLVGCIPHNEQGNKYDVPKAAIQQCRPRLIQLCSLARPKLVVQVGALAEKHWDAKLWDIHLPKLDKPQFVRIDHPAFILRAGIQDRGLLIQKCEATLEDAVLEVFGSNG
jgi:uracil-DNA glycosylase